MKDQQPLMLTLYTFIPILQEFQYCRGHCLYLFIYFTGLSFITNGVSITMCCAEKSLPLVDIAKF